MSLSNNLKKKRKNRGEERRGEERRDRLQLKNKKWILLKSTLTKDMA